MSLKILSWNSRSIKGKLVELRHHLNSNFYHVILIQETWLNASNAIEIPKYTCLRKDRVSNSRHPHGGVLIFVHSSVPFKAINFAKTEFSDSIFIRIFSDTQDIIVGSIYCSPLRKCAERKSDYQKLLSRPGPFVLAGDFNAKHKAWNNDKNNSSGLSLLKLANENLCDLHFTDKPTTIPPRGQPSFLDIVVSKNVAGISKPVIINDLSSDHVPITFEIPINVQPTRTLKIPNYAKANWKKFKAKISSDIVKLPILQPKSINEIDANISIFNEIVNKASRDSIPLKRPYEFRYKLSQNVQELIRDRNFIRRHIARYPILKSEFNRLNRDLKKEINLMNQANWNDKLSSLKTEDCSLYALAKSIKRKRVSIPPLKNTNSGEIVFADKEKAELLAGFFLKAHQIDNGPTYHSDLVQKSIQFIQDAPVSFHDNDKTSRGEVNSWIEFLRTKKAPGFDEMACRVVKNLPDPAISFLSDTFNSCLRLAYFPVAWKIGKIFPIRKPNKDLSLPDSYRQITLLPIIGKLFEKTVLSRMIDFEEEKQLLVKQQFGFRTKHSTSKFFVSWRLSRLDLMRINLQR